MLNFERHGRVGLMTLNRPEALNALTKDMILDMYHQLLEWNLDDTLKVMVLRSASANMFCAGGDVRSVYAMRDLSLELKMQFFAIEYHLDYLLSSCKKPIISFMDGVCMGGGVGIGMHVAYPIVGENIKFSMPETAIGLFPDVGAVAIFNRLSRAWQTYLGVFAQGLGAESLEAADLVYGIMSPQHWDEVIEDFVYGSWKGSAAEEVQARLNPRCKNINANLIEPLDEFWRFDVDDFSQLMQNIDAADSVAWQAFRQKIAKLSPLSMQVTFEHLRRSQGLNLAQALARDFCLLQHFLVHPEFYEGVRALLIDKDKNPQWTYQHWQDVPRAVIHSFFDESRCMALNLHQALEKPFNIG